jgi:hypothetical protein
MNEIVNRDPPETSRLHRGVYFIMLGLAVVLAFSVWGFAGPGYSDFALFVVTGFVAVVVGLQAALWAVAGRRRYPRGSRESFRRWADSEFVTWQGRLKARNAAIEVLLPLAAAAFMMLACAIVANFVIPGGA